MKVERRCEIPKTIKKSMLRTLTMQKESEVGRYIVESHRASTARDMAGRIQSAIGADTPHLDGRSGRHF